MSFLKHTACPACGSRDARAVYDEGSEFCFSCRDYKRGDAIGRHKAVAKEHKLYQYNDKSTLPAHAAEWLAQYDLTAAETALYTYDYDRQHLVFRDGDFTNSRNFDAEDHRKYVSYGMKPYSVHGKGRWLVCVEDAVSAIKVARHTSAMPLYGSEIPLEPVLKAVTEGYMGILIWLDPDKITAGVKFSQKFKELGVWCRVIASMEDPKMYSDRDIRGFLRRATT